MDRGANSLDDILCDPELAAEFDRVAEIYAPGFKPLDYRWAALKLRKTAKDARTRAELLKPGRLQAPMRAFKEAEKKAPPLPGVYLLSSNSNAQVLYVGGALSLRRRFEVQFQRERRGAWPKGDLRVKLFTSEANFPDLVGYQSIYVGQFKPRFNSEELAAV